jgi:hypothetical protein
MTMLARNEQRCPTINEEQIHQAEREAITNNEDIVKPLFGSLWPISSRRPLITPALPTSTKIYRAEPLQMGREKVGSFIVYSNLI